MRSPRLRRHVLGVGLTVVITLLGDPWPVSASVAGAPADLEGRRLGLLLAVAVFALAVSSSPEVGRTVTADPDSDLPGIPGELKQLADLFQTAMASLERLSRHNNLVLNSAAEAIFGVDVKERVTFANVATGRLLDCPLPELVGRSMHGALRASRPGEGTPDGARCPLCATLSTGRAERDADALIQRRDGGLVAVEVRCTPVLDQGQLVGAVVALSDITERKRAEQEIQRQRDALYQREKVATMGALLADLAHELSNPLAAIVARSAVLAEVTTAETVNEHVGHIERAAKRASLIVRSFLALARQRPPKHEPVSLNDVVQAVLALLGYQLTVSDVEVVTRLAPDLPRVWADPHQLHQVVVNLVTNARHAMREVGRPRRLVVVTQGLAGGGRVRLEVADTGPGVVPELRTRIFEPFFTTKTEEEGTGLGLALCQSIVADHRGALWVEDHEPVGARFVVELPVEPEVAAAGPAAPEAASARGRKGTILVVDDDADIASAIAEVLIADGHEVETVTDALRALERLRHRRYDAILSDIRMPRLDGPGLSEEIERLHPELLGRIVFVTGDTLSVETMRFLERTAALHLQKPFDIDHLRRTVRRILDAPAPGPNA